jgi:glutaredoxin/glutathione-dependent peroxiredoxin
MVSAFLLVCRIGSIGFFFFFFFSRRLSDFLTFFNRWKKKNRFSRKMASAAVEIKVGDALPKQTFSVIKDSEKGPEPVESDSLWSSGKVILFGLPGAFTPTCSAKHLPGFVEDIEQLRAKGVAGVYCVSVNDAFVMRAWGEAHKAEGAVTLLADGDASFVSAIGLAADTGSFGGLRSKRFVIVANDGIVTHVAIDESGKFEVTSSEAVANFI